MKKRNLLLSLPVVVAAGFTAAAQAETVEDFYTKNHEITFLMGFGPGSSHDTWARVVGKYWTKYLPGHPVFVVRAMPGAGDIIMTNYLYTQAPKDGTYIGSIAGALPAQVLMGVENTQVDPEKLGYVGSPEMSDHVCMAMAASGFITIDDVKIGRAHV